MAFAPREDLSRSAGFFRFGRHSVCYGRSSAGHGHSQSAKILPDILPEIRVQEPVCRLPFDPAEVIENLRRERYLNGPHQAGSAVGITRAVRNAYSVLRPLIPVPLRKRLQRIHLRGWENIPFPHWPLDCSVDKIFEQLLVLSLKARNVSRVPFIWFWPDGHSSCAIMTHDVETSSGRDFCSQLMDIDDSRDIKSSFQIIPEKRYNVPPSFLNAIRERGFEVNVHDLNHDGDLFGDHDRFLKRAERINQYAREYGASGFRSGTLYRNPDWYDAFQFSYDMSFPNVGHLEAQRGGCCTVMPYFIGKILELPLTTTQDYSLFHILNDYSLDLWKRQVRLILDVHGLVSFIVHPDYVIEKQARDTYAKLLDYLSNLRSRENVWLTLPREVDRWWRERSQMKLVPRGGTYEIEGAGHERARLAWASVDGDRLAYSLEAEKGVSTSGRPERIAG